MRKRSPEHIRRDALAILGELADPSAVELLEHAAISLEAGAEGSDDIVIEGQRVTLELDAWHLGLLRAVPALRDALSAALAVAIASDRGEKLLALTTRWAACAGETEAPYRGAPPRRITAKQALVSYLEGASNRRLACAVQLARVEEASHEVVVSGLQDTSPVDRSEVVAAVRDLFAQPTLRVGFGR